ncbi:MAG: isoleucine--tRNA ligase, partial [Candidatus Blackburnbacteria bacterium]|nr:isoleucine--tRNA ligase [Candidatus Blackburnbacteria bacterium]
DFPEMERRILEWWYKSGVVEKYLQKNKKSPKYFSFLDGPITANNPMGVHHAWGRTYKDLWQRYKNMQGFRQRFQNGFDCQGLWVEVEVEKELGLKSKKDIENLVPGDKKASIAKFVELCKGRVYKFAEIQTGQSKRLAYFMDWDNSYYTLSDNNNYTIWHFLKKCHERGLIYRGRDSVPWCPRCGTAISQHEMLTENYKETTHDSVYVEYPIKGRKNEFLLVWTTTPWTLPGNVAVAVDKDKKYVAATGSVKNNVYYLLESVAKKLKLKIVKNLKGGKLIGLKYESPFDNFPRIRKSLGDWEHAVIASDRVILPVSEEEGTGIVHIAPGAGTEDFQLGKKFGLPVIELIDEEANYLVGLGEFSARNAKNYPRLILDYLKKADAGLYLFDIVPYKHRYPTCWRCKTELVWRVVDEWYIAMDPLREPMKKVAKEINWHPSFGLKRELDWLSNMHDWLISKKRYWGLALPIWECKKCGHFEVIGGREELKEKAVRGWEKFEGNSPHRPWIDEIKIKCGKCGEVVERVPDVGNPWLDAGIVPFSTISQDNRSKPLYREDRGKWEKWFPADFITESFPGQFKNWFYSLIAMSTVLENREPFKTVLGFGTLFGEDGRPMHKSWGNAIEFNKGADKIGVDVMRWMYARQDPAQNLLFGYHFAGQTRRDFHLMLWNIYSFFVTYANLDRWISEGKTPVKTKNVLDRWILSRLNETLGTITSALDKYDARTATIDIEKFVQDLSLWYVRRSRDRVGPNAPGGKDKDTCYSVLHHVLVSLSRLLAPFTPFVAEEMYKNLTGEDSVHLSNWPKVEKVTERDRELMRQMELVRKIVEKGHAARKEAKIPVRQPLASITVSCKEKLTDLGFLQLIKDELNIKDILWKVAKTKAEPEVKLDTKITLELAEEGKARELARQIQEERKKMGASLDAKVAVISPWLPKNRQLFEWLRKRVLADRLEQGDKLEVKLI